MNSSELENTRTDGASGPLNPFPGLRPFRTDEDFIFFGRDDQTGELLGRLRRHRFLAVLGSSGSGKSSLVRAGLLPALYGGTIVDAGSSWEVAVMRPGGNPLFQLSRALCAAELYDADAEDVLFHLQATLRRSRRGLIEAVRQSSLEEDTNVLLVVDQFEEIFRFGQSGSFHVDAAVDFIDLLLHASREVKSTVYVVITMRADFLGDCAQFPGLVEAINDGKYLIPRLGRDQLRTAIEGPVRVAGAEMAQRLTHRLLNDVGDDHDQLPVLQHALMRTWEYWLKDHTEGEPVDLRHFEATGGLREALSRHADEVYAELPDDRHRQVAEKLFKTITEHDPDERGVRRPTRLSDASRITGAEESEIITVVEAFRRPGRTFLTPYNVPLVSDTIIDVSHESFMRVWRRLERWVEEESQAARIYRRLADTAQLQAEGRAGLYRDPDLQIASSWRDNDQPRSAWGEQYHPGFERAMAFLEESERAARAEADAREAAREREVAQAKKLAEAERVSARNFKRFATSMAVLALIAIALSAWALWLEGRARESETQAASNARAAEASRIVAESAQAEALRAKAVAEDLLTRSRHEQGVTWLERARLLLQENRAFEARILAAKALGFGEDAGKDAAFRQENPVLLKPDSPEWRAAQDLLTEPEVAPIWKTPSRFHHEASEVIQVRYSRDDGRFLVSAADSGKAILWDASSGEEIITLEAEGLAGSGGSFRPEFKPDGSLLAAPGGEAALLWKIPSGEPLPRVASTVGDVRRVSFRPGGTVLAIGGERGFSLYDYESGETIPLESPPGSPVSAVDSGGPATAVDDLAWNQDGSLLAVLASGTARIWDVGARSSRSPLDCAGSTLVRFSPDGSLLVAAGSSSYFWDVKGGRPLDIPGPVPEGGSFHDVAFHPAGALLALCDEGGKIHLWDSGEEIGILDQVAVCHSIAFSHDGKVLASSGNDTRVRFWNLFTEDGKVKGLGRDGLLYYKLTDEQRMGPDLLVQNSRVAISPDGTLAAAAGSRWRGFLGGVGVGKLSTSEVVWSEMIREPDYLEFSPDGSLLAMNTPGGGGADLPSVLMYDVESWTLFRSVPGGTRASFSPDGSMLAALVPQGTVLYDLARGRELGVLPDGLTGAEFIRISPDGSKFCVADTSRVKLLGWPDGEPIGPAIALPATLRDLEFSPDGRTLAALVDSPLVKLWEVSGGESIPAPDLNPGVQEAGALAFSPDGQLFAVGGSQETRLWDVRAGSRFVEIATLPVRADGDLAFGPDGTTLLTAAARDGGDQSVWVWEIPRRRRAAFGVDAEVTAVAYSPDGRRLFCGRSDGRVSILDALTGEEIDLLEALGGQVEEIAVTRDGDMMAAGGMRAVRLWSVESRGLIRSLMHTDRVTSVRFNADGTRLLTGGRQIGVYVWNVSTGSPVFARGDEGRSLASVRYSPDDRLIALAGSDGTVLLWDAARDVELERLEGQCVAFDPAGRLLATGLRDGTIRLWTPAGDPAGALTGHTAPVVRLAFSPDGGRLASGDQDGTTRLWDVSTRLPVAVLRSPDRGSLQSLPFSFSPDGAALAVALPAALGTGIAIYDAREPIPDASRYVPYLDWYRIDGRDVVPRIRRNLYRPIAMRRPPRQAHTHLAILAGEQPDVEKYRALFGECLRSRNWNGAAALLKKLPEAESGRERKLLVDALLSAARVEAKRGLTTFASRLLQLAESVKGDPLSISRARAEVLIDAGKTDEARAALERGAELARAAGDAGRPAFREIQVDRFHLELSQGALTDARDALDVIWSLPDVSGANGRETLAFEYARAYGEAGIGSSGEGSPSTRDDEVAAAALQVLLAAYSAGTSEAQEPDSQASLLPGLGPSELSLIPNDAEWKYSDEGVEPDPRWTDDGFDDSGWARGPAPLGFGDPNRKETATSIRRDRKGTGRSALTFYFRHPFHFEGLPDADELIVRVVRDDGVAVYLNGEEIVRDNLPDGPLSYQTTAMNAIDNPNETDVHEFRIAPDQLRAGGNVLAAEVHQANTSSSDVHFALGLSAVTTPSGRFLRALEAREEGESRGLIKRALSILPPSMRAELGATLLFASQADANGSAVPPSVTEDPDAWRVRRRVQQALGRRVLAVDAARRELALRMADTAKPDWSRIVELSSALRAFGESPAAEEFLRKKMAGDAPPSRDAVRLLVELLLEQGRDPVETADTLPNGSSYLKQGELGVWMETLRAMREEGVIRINCGGGRYASAAGTVWAGDRCFRAGKVYISSHDIRGTDDDPIYRSERWFPTEEMGPSVYRIPIGSGRFRVTLHFAEILRETGRVFDVLLEGEPAVRDYDPVAAVGFAAADKRSVEVTVSDGWLDIGVDSLNPSSGRHPKLSGIEIERVK